MKSRVLLLILALALCVVPAFAQTNSTNTVSFNGVSFAFPSSLATNVGINQFAGDPTTLQQPGGPEVKHTEFVLYTALDAESPDANGQPTIPQSMFEGAGGIRVYSAADFAGYDFAGTELKNLQTLLSQRPDLSKYMVADTGDNSNNLPFVPEVAAAQVLRAQAHYIDTPSLKGVAYVTLFRQDVSPITGDQLLYTFQGLSADGSTVVAAVFHLNTTLFPATIPDNFDYNAFSQSYQDYITKSVATLVGAKPTDFTPSLSDLDALVQSITLTGTPTTNTPPVVATQVQPPATAEATPSDATLGGLAGVTWTLASYGDPAKPTAALSTPPVTLVFTQSGVTGNGGCNGYGGSFQYNQNTIGISQIIHTMMACTDQAANDQESAFLDALSKASAYQINGTQLQISYDGGVLTFNAS